MAPSGSARNSITTTTTTTTTEMPKDLDDTWPTRGAITFANYSLRYRPGLPLVLYQLNISIQPQEKVRHSAFKTILYSLFDCNITVFFRSVW